MRKILSTIIISGLFISGCQSGDSSLDKNSFDSSVVTKTNTTTQLIDSAAAVQPVQNTIQTLPTNTPVTASPTTSITAPTAPGMNPAHGQPGHRCDISVGAPLNSAPAKTATTATTTPTAQPVAVSASTPAPAKTAPGMNPPHGQPGHKCEIAVGAPLNSAPTKPAVTNIETQTKTAEGLPASISADSVKKQ